MPICQVSVTDMSVTFTLLSQVLKVDVINLTYAGWQARLPVSVRITDRRYYFRCSDAKRLVDRTRDVDRRTVDSVRRVDDTQHQRQTADRWNRFIYVSILWNLSPQYDYLSPKTVFSGELK